MEVGDVLRCVYCNGVYEHDDDCTREERHEWLHRYHRALDEGYSMSAAICKANDDDE